MVPALGTRKHLAPDDTGELRWQWSRLPALPSQALYAVLALRQQVFAVEQRCAYLDADGIDLHAWHLLGWERAEPGTLSTYLRVVDPGARFAEPAIGRVVVAAARRGTGLGRALMARGIAGCATLHPGRQIRIAAQCQLERFYASLGFAIASAPFDEDGIAHVEMLLGVPPEPAQRMDIPTALR
jgi:ElaA protein